MYIAKSGSSLFLDRTSETILATFLQLAERNLEGEIPVSYHQSSREPWQDGNGFSLLERDRRHLRVPVPKTRRRETLKCSPGEGHRNSYIHEVRHDLRIVNLGILRVVIPSLNRYSPGRLDQPAGKRPLPELGGLRSETEEAAFLPVHGR